MEKQTAYQRIIEDVFFKHYTPGATTVPFHREEIVEAAEALGLPRPKNVGDVIYAFRFRAEFPERIRATAPPGAAWTIRKTGGPNYMFVALAGARITPDLMLRKTRIPDSTPGLIAKYQLSDEQAVLAMVRYNRLLDIFTGVACYSLQTHLRTSVPGIGQIEIDEVYVGIGATGVHYIFPVQAKGGTDELGIVQLEQDLAWAAHRYPELECRGISVQKLSASDIVIFSFQSEADTIVKTAERHYSLLRYDQLTVEELREYKLALDSERPAPL